MLNDKVVIVTGASSGIGRYVARGLLRRGARVVANGRNESRLRRHFRAEDDRYLHTVPGDVGDPATGSRLAAAALERFGRIDVLVNNAGTFVPKPFLDVTDAELSDYLTTTVKGSFFTSQAVVPAMIEQRDGVIVNIGSMWVEHPLEATPCSASQVAKGGMHTLTRHLAIEFAAHNIRVNTVAPGVIDTPLYGPLMDRDAFQSLAALHPLRRVGSMDDVAQWVYHLAGDGGRFVTGQTLFVDGGITAGAHAG